MQVSVLNRRVSSNLGALASAGWRPVIGALLLTSACLHVEEVAIEDLPSYLAPVSGAIEVSARGRAQDIGVSYLMREPYPAEITVAAIQERIPREWAPRSENYLNPGIPTAHVRGWTSYEDRTTDPESKVHMWAAQWDNEVGDILSFTLLYRSVGPFEERPGAPTTTVFQVYSSVSSRASIERWKKAAGVPHDGSKRIQQEVRLTEGSRETVAAEAGFMILRPVDKEPSGSRLRSALTGGVKYYFDEAEILLNGEHFRREGVEVTEGPSFPKGTYPMVIVPLTEAGSERLRDWSSANVGHHLGMFLDGQLSQAPIVKSTLDGSVMFMAQSPEEAESIRRRLTADR